METRELRYFVAVAEEQHVGRAARRLGIAQPPLSRAIQRLERTLGVTLFDRGPRGVTVTEAGAVLLAEGRAALDAVEAADRRTRRAGAPGSGLVLVAKAGASTRLLTRLLAAHAARPGAVAVEVVLCGIGEQGPMLRDGRADVALLHAPFDSLVGLDTEELHREGQVLVLPAGHRWAGRREVTVAEAEGLPDPPPVRWPRPDGTYPDGQGAPVRDTAQLLALVALGRASVVLPSSVRDELGPDTVTVPVVDAPQVTTFLAWPPHSRSRAVADLVSCV